MKNEITQALKGFGADKAGGVQSMVDSGALQWRPDMTIGDTKILPPVGSGHNPAAVMDWAKGRADTAKDMYAGLAAAPKQTDIVEALRRADTPTYRTIGGGRSDGDWNNWGADSQPSHIARQSSADYHGGGR